MYLMSTSHKIDLLIEKLQLNAKKVKAHWRIALYDHQMVVAPLKAMPM